MQRLKIILISAIMAASLFTGCARFGSNADVNIKPTDTQTNKATAALAEEQNQPLADAVATDSSSESVGQIQSPQNSSSIVDKGQSQSSTDSSNAQKQPAAEVVVKTDTNVSNEKASQVLKNIDQEMDNVLNILNNLDDVNDQDLNFE